MTKLSFGALLAGLNDYTEGKLSRAFLSALRVYRSPDDMEMSLADQFRVIADRIEEDKPEEDSGKRDVWEKPEDWDGSKPLA